MPLGGFIHIFLNPIFQQGKIQRPYNFVEQSSLFTLNVGGAAVPVYLRFAVPLQCMLTRVLRLLVIIVEKVLVMQLVSLTHTHDSVVCCAEGLVYCRRTL